MGSYFGKEIELMQKRKVKKTPMTAHRTASSAFSTRGRVWWIRRPDSGYNVGKEEESGYDAARQQKILRNPEKIDLRKPDQRPMAERS